MAAPHLLLGMLSIAYQYGPDPDVDNNDHDREEGGKDDDSGASLSRLCFDRARVMINSNEKKARGSFEKLVVVQTYLLLQIHAMMYLCGSNSAYALKIHPRMVALARSGGLMQAMQAATTAVNDLDALWREFIKTESHKRCVCVCVWREA
jgi:hypothetical protein